MKAPTAQRPAGLFHQHQHQHHQQQLRLDRLDRPALQERMALMALPCALTLSSS